MTQEEFLELMLPIGEPIVKPREELVEKIALRYRWMNLAGYTIPVVKLEEDERYLRSDVCEWLYLHIDTPFSASYTVVEGSEVWSLRSNQETGLDVESIAKLYGGGGHKPSAGFTYNLDVITYDTRQEAEEASRQ